jgi:hypothetical protein
MGNQLHQTAGFETPRVAQIHEQQATMVAFGRGPPGEADGPPHIVDAEGTAPRVSIVVDGQRSGLLHVDRAGYPPGRQG